MQQGVGVSGTVPPRSVGRGKNVPPRGSSAASLPAAPAPLTGAQRGAGVLFLICKGILIKTTAGFVHETFGKKFLVRILKTFN